MAGLAVAGTTTKPHVWGAAQTSHPSVQGLGLDILVELLQALQPSHVLQLQSPNAKRNLPGGAFWLRETRLPQQQQGAPVVYQLASLKGSIGPDAAGSIPDVQDAAGTAAADAAAPHDASAEEQHMGACSPVCPCAPRQDPEVCGR